MAHFTFALQIAPLRDSIWGWAYLLLRDKEFFVWFRLMVTRSEEREILLFF